MAVYLMSDSIDTIMSHSACQLNKHAHIILVCSLRDANVIKSKPTWKLKHSNSILEYLWY